MQTSVQPLTQRDASCAATSPVGTVDQPVDTEWASLFPPRDADAETRRRWVATSPWPEVVFACAGAC